MSLLQKTNVKLDRQDINLPAGLPAVGMAGSTAIISISTIYFLALFSVLAVKKDFSEWLNYHF
jgi:hypothetical protein